MKVLILGSRGLLGQALAESFVDLNPLLWDKEQADLTDFKTTEERILQEKPEVIINAAAFTEVDAAEQNPALAQKINAEVPSHLAMIANKINAQLVYYSTEYVFDGKDKNGYKEDALPSPLSVYGRTKLEGERGAARANKHYVIRLSRLFGKSGSGKKSFVDKILELSSAQNELKVVVDEYSCITYAPDLADRTRQILESKPASGIFHSPNEGSINWYEYAQEIFKIARIDVELVPVSASQFPRRAQRPVYGELLNTKLPPMRPWEVALEEYLVTLL